MTASLSQPENKSFKKAYSLALRYLNRKDYCSYDLEEKLRTRIDSINVIKAVISSLANNRIINDDNYAKTLSSNLIKYKFKGLLYIKSVLFKKKLDYILKDYLLLQELEALEITSLKRYITKTESRFDRDKLIKHLLSRGYEFNKIKSLLDNKNS